MRLTLPIALALLVSDSSSMTLNSIQRSARPLHEPMMIMEHTSKNGTKAEGKNETKKKAPPKKDAKKQKEVGRSLDRKIVDRCWRTEQKWETQLKGARAIFPQNPNLAEKLLQAGLGTSRVLRRLEMDLCLKD